MSDESAAAPGDGPKKSGKTPLLIGAVLAVVLGGAGFGLTYAGLLPPQKGGYAETADAHGSTGVREEVAFVPVDPIIVSLPGGSASRHLRFRAELETTPADAAAVAEIMPRILDVLNSYLRAVSTEDLERPTALIRLRAQMLRRVRLVAAPREVSDLLVTEFVLN